MNTTLIIVATLLISAVIFIPIGMLVRKKTAESKIQSAEIEAKKIIENGKFEAEKLKKEELIKAKEEVLQLRTDLDQEIKERRGDIQTQERRLIQKEENLEKRVSIYDGKEKDLEKKYAENEEKRKELDELVNKEYEELQRISGLTSEQAKDQLLSELDREIAQEKAQIIRDHEAKAKEEAEKLEALKLKEAEEAAKAKEATKAPRTLTKKNSTKSKGKAGSKNK